MLTKSREKVNAFSVRNAFGMLPLLGSGDTPTRTHDMSTSNESSRDSNPGKRPRGGHAQERKSAPSLNSSAPKPKPRAGASNLTDAADLIFGKVIGRGTQGTVRVAKHATTGKRYVVKLLPLGLESTSANGGDTHDPLSMTDFDARRVMAEAETLKLASSHPNVVRFHGAFRRQVPQVPNRTATASSKATHPTSTQRQVPAQQKQELCIVMSHCEGGDLASMLKRALHWGEAFSETAVMRWLVQLLLGLHHIHGKSILHRDIKPANVFLSKSKKVVRLGDFGIAKALREGDDFAQTVVGTPLYMSPELCQGKPYTYASDVWALGCVAYEMATSGVKAFDAPAWPSLLVKIINCDYAPVPSRFSRPFAALVASMLSPDPTDRPTTTQLLNTPLVRRHCEALLRDAKDASGRAEADNETVSLTTPRVSRNSESSSSFPIGAAAVADAEKAKAAEARYAARQNATRRDRAAVRDACPKRAAALVRNDLDNEKRMAQQTARTTAEAEGALLCARGFGEAEWAQRVTREKTERVVTTVVENTNASVTTRHRRERAFQSRPLLGRTEAEAVQSRETDVSDGDENADGVNPLSYWIEGGERDGNVESISKSARNTRHDEFVLMEARTAEAEARAYAEANENLSARDTEIDTAVRAVASDAATATKRDAPESSETTETKELSRGFFSLQGFLQRRRDRRATGVTRSVAKRASAAAAAAAAAASARIGNRAFTKSFSLNYERTRTDPAPTSVEWPPHREAASTQTAKDAALEQRVVAKLRSLLRYAKARPVTASGTSLKKRVGKDSDSDASTNSDDCEHSLSAEFETLFEGGEV
jgi:serine/threonine protein kinase